MNAGAISLGLSALALAFAGVAMTNPNSYAPSGSRRLDQTADLERRIDELSQEVMLLRAQRTAAGTSNTPGLGTGSPSSSKETGDTTEGYATPGGTDNASELEAIVNEAVDKKTARVLDKMRVKQNKKPTFAAFASVLELTDQQRAETERVVVDGQRESYEILNTPTANGNNLMDELVDIVARRFVTPRQNNGMGKWIGRILSETIPGTNETYAARLGVVTDNMKATFKRSWSATQYREFEEWGVNPTEITGIPGSPNDALGKRIMQRAKDLGAKVPESEPN
ncbi:MAG: hypothetical protein V3T86_18045 [Planctomycetota bacterium]